jgi:hypothetical protein
MKTALLILSISLLSFSGETITGAIVTDTTVTITREETENINYLVYCPDGCPNYKTICIDYYKIKNSKLLKDSTVTYEEKKYMKTERIKSN